MLKFRSIENVGFKMDADTLLQALDSAQIVPLDNQEISNQIAGGFETTGIFGEIEPQIFEEQLLEQMPAVQELGIADPNDLASLGLSTMGKLDL